MSDITVCIPSIPPRAELLTRALASVSAQTLQPAAIIVEIDHDGEGAPATRDRALRKATTDWVAFLDDDDEMKPEHLEVLRAGANEYGADYVFSYYEIIDAAGRNLGDLDPVLGNFGKIFDPAEPSQTTITTLVRTKLAQDVGFACMTSDELIHGQRRGEDFEFTVGCVNRGARIVHIPHRTWLWHHGTGNTSGRPWNRRDDWV